MLHSTLFSQQEKYRLNQFSCSLGEEDRPYLVQFCANDPQVILTAAKQVERYCDGVDLNLGCPQGIARRGHYGSFLQEEPELISEIVKTLHENLIVPVTCKIRVLDTVEATVEYAKMLEDSGCQLLGVHGRTREMKGQFQGLADWDKIKAVKDALSIPVIANGNMQTYQDVQDCLDYTGCDGVMAATGLLRNPSLFAGKDGQVDVLELAREYLDITKIIPTTKRQIRTHMYNFLEDHLKEAQDLRSVLGLAWSMQDFYSVLDVLEKRQARGNLMKLDGDDDSDLLNVGGMDELDGLLQKEKEEGVQEHKALGVE
eukprot:TRINITY_DN4503_c0_g2_i1.p1 TRINITY_DN4503_c0_g2~~TRINITY_DN4503_c0_g2_i1.p1  ORF type:complete len:314 (+),score=103.84 TRINITY_DN4503_c0_g2_i1:175-1116(+)